MKDLFKQLNLEEILNIEKVDSSQNSVYKVTTKENNYLVKEYSDNAISNKEDLITRTKQINISEYLNNSGIKTILPIKFNNEIFINYNNKYYFHFYPSYPFGLFDCHLHESSHISSNPRIASHPSSSFAFAGSA